MQLRGTLPRNLKKREQALERFGTNNRAVAAGLFTGLFSRLTSTWMFCTAQVRYSWIPIMANTPWQYPFYRELPLFPFIYAIWATGR